MAARLKGALAGLERINLTGLRFRLFDADGQVVGRMAAQLAKILQGKDKPIWSNNKDLGDIVIVVNASKAVFTGRKWKLKTYMWHTGEGAGYAGGVKEYTAAQMWQKDPCEIIRFAVRGMLPKNALEIPRLRKLRIFPGPEHRFAQLVQEPEALPPRRVRDKRLDYPMPLGFEPVNPEAYEVRLRGARRKPKPVAVDVSDLLDEQERELVAFLREPGQGMVPVGNSQRAQ